MKFVEKNAEKMLKDLARSWNSGDEDTVFYEMATWWHCPHNNLRNAAPLFSTKFYWNLLNVFGDNSWLIGTQRKLDKEPLHPPVKNVTARDALKVRNG